MSEQLPHAPAHTVVTAWPTDGEWVAVWEDANRPGDPPTRSPVACWALVECDGHRYVTGLVSVPDLLAAGPLEPAEQLHGFIGYDRDTDEKGA